MVANPYIRVRARQAAHRRRAVGPLGLVLRPVASVVALGLITLVVRRVFFGFIDEGAAALAAGTAGATLRLGLVITAITAIDAYDAVVRGEDRDVLALLPVEPGRVVIAALVGLVGRRWWTIPSAAVLLAPIAAADPGGPVAWAASVAGVAAVQLFAWPLAVAVYLLAVDAAESRGLASTLDAVRGQNPRELAAFLYAPGVVLAVAGAALWASSEGAAAVVRGEAAAALWFVPAPVVGAGIAFSLPALGRRAWFRAGTVLADIDARYAALTERDGASSTHVYLDWAVRFLPATWRRRALFELRHGWRGRRAWISGAWILGFAGAAAGWTEHAAGPARALVVATLAVAVVGSVTFALERDEPEFLRWWLPPGPGPRGVVRAIVVLAWAAPAIVLPALAAGFFGGWAPLALVAALGTGAGAALVAAAVVTARLGRVGPWLYAPAAAGVVLAVAGASGSLA